MTTSPESGLVINSNWRASISAAISGKCLSSRMVPP
jgi:hypothetical protein